MFVCPYLHFDGACAEAFAFYANVFAAELPEILPMPDGSGTTMHARIEIAPGMVLMGSDHPQGDAALPQQSVSIHVMPDSVDEGRRLFGALSQGGTEISPFAPNFFSAGFGVAKDRFGTHWMINVPPAEA